MAQGAILEDAEPLPDELTADMALRKSRFNVYEVMPPGMNSWERDFTDSLDSDATDSVLWWHRNPVKKPYSIRVLLENGVGFYPDFLIGIRGRESLDNGLLADTKYAYETTTELPKILSKHPSYGRVLILSRSGKKPWAIAEVSSVSGKPILVETFRPVEAAGY